MWATPRMTQRQEMSNMTNTLLAKQSRGCRLNDLEEAVGALKGQKHGRP